MKFKDESPFGQRLLEAFNHLPKVEIAKKLEVSNSTITDYVKGRIPPGETLLTISAMTGVSIDWLLTGRGPKQIDELLEAEKIKKQAVQGFLVTQLAKLAEEESDLQYRKEKKP